MIILANIFIGLLVAIPLIYMGWFIFCKSLGLLSELYGEVNE